MKRWLPPLALAACTLAQPRGHVGPVTATAAAAGRTFACSQAGVLEHVDGAPRPFADPGFRPFALAGRDAGGGLPALLLAGGGTPARSGELALFDLRGERLAHARVADDVVYGTALASGRPPAAAACAGGDVHVLALPGLEHVASWHHEGPAVAVAFAPGGELLASAGHDGKILLGAPHAGADPLALLDHTAAVTCLAWTTDGQRLLSGSRDGKVRLHDRSGRLVHTWSRLHGAVVAVQPRGTGCACSLASAPGERGEPDEPLRTIVLALP